MLTVSQQHLYEATNREKLAKKCKQIPTPLGGLALGIASLGSIWSIVTPDWAVPMKIASAIVAITLVLMIAIKFILHPKLIKEELSHPVIGSVMATCVMAVMVVANSLLSLAPEVFRIIWLAAVICHIILCAGFFSFRIPGFKLEHMLPSWFIPPVGIIVAAVTSQGMNFSQLVYCLFIFGISSYFILLPVMLYRLLFCTAIPDATLPTFTIMAAPASLSLAGYLTIASKPDPLLVVILAPLAIFMTGLVYIGFIRLLRLPFVPAYSAFTFPMVIGATALIKLTNWLFLQDNLAWLAKLTGNLAEIELIIATAIVFYVAIRYCVHYVIQPLLNAGK